MKNNKSSTVFPLLFPKRAVTNENSGQAERTTQPRKKIKLFYFFLFLFSPRAARSISLKVVVVVILVLVVVLVIFFNNLKIINSL